MQPTNIWIIDDDSLASFYIQRLCEINNSTLKISVFNAANIAFAKLATSLESKSELPDIILLDIYMPVASGWDFLAWYDSVKQIIRKSIKIYVMSSSLHPDDKSRAQSNENVKQYLLKPLKMPTMQAILR